MCIFQGIYSSHLNCRIYWHKVIHNILLFFLTSIGSIVMFSHFLTLVICVIFFLDHSVLRFINFIVCVCVFPENQCFCFTDFSLLFLLSTSLISAIFTFPSFCLPRI